MSRPPELDAATMLEPLVVEFKITFSPHDANVVDAVARVMKKSRDELVAEILTQPVSRFMQQTLTELSLVLCGATRAQVDAYRRLRKRIGG